MAESTNDDDSIRSLLTRQQRSVDGDLSIDPGFVNHRRIQTILRDGGTAVIDAMINDLPPSIPDWQREVRIDHIYTRVLLRVCELTRVQPLRTLLNERRGNLFCSVESLEPSSTIGQGRATNRILTPGYDDVRVELQYDVEKVRASTTRTQLTAGDELAIVGTIRGATGGLVIAEPLVIGAPWLTLDDDVLRDAEWYSHDFFENFIEDVDNFSRVRDVDAPSDFQVMSNISEKAFKTCMAEILGDSIVNDWGGEMSDHYSAHLYVGGRRMTAAFLLKGPARFRPMDLNHLGKNNDQIYRLSKEPAQLLVVQHCHDVLPAVRDTLRAFAVRPGFHRRYCVIDGRDSLRLLMAYDKVDYAIELSKRQGG